MFGRIGFRISNTEHKIFTKLLQFINTSVSSKYFTFYTSLVYYNILTLLYNIFNSRNRNRRYGNNILKCIFYRL